MTGQTGLVSPALAAAQQQLYALRQAHRGEKRPFSPPSPLVPALTNAVSQLPAHLGWESARLTAVLRPTPAPETPSTQLKPVAATPVLVTNHNATVPNTVPLEPDLALALLRQKLVAPGRVWLLLRHIDSSGQGWVTEATAREQLTTATAGLQICGWRQLRNLLAQGDGLFWQRANGRLWLRNRAKVAAALGMERVNGRSVTLPVTTLTQPIGTVRAHFYASFHSGRRHSNPIARTTLTQLSGRQRQTLRRYERKTGIQRRVNIALGQRLSQQNQEETYWRQGNAAFVLRDTKGKHGKKNEAYLAWQLPNSYQGPHQTTGKRRQKRLNQRLADLLTQGTTGNGRCYRRRYAGQGKRQRHASYWASAIGSSHSTQLWFHQPTP